MKASKFKVFMLTILIIMLAGSLFGETIYNETIGSAGTTTGVSSYTGWLNYGTVTYTGTTDARNTYTSTGDYTGASGGGNVYFVGGSSDYLQIAGINTLGYTNIRLACGIYKTNSNTNTSNAENGSNFQIRYSTDGTTWSSPLAYTLPTGAGTDATYFWITFNEALPAVASLYLKFTDVGASEAIHFRLDDITLTGTTFNLYNETVGVGANYTPISSYSGWSNTSPISYVGTSTVDNSYTSAGSYSNATGTGNVYISNGTYFQIEGLNTAGYSDLWLSFAVHKDTGSETGTNLKVEAYDGSTLTGTYYVNIPTSSGDIWINRTISTALPATATLILKFSDIHASRDFRIDDIRIRAGIKTPDISSPICLGKLNTNALLGASITAFNNSNATERGIYYSTTSGFADGTGTKVSVTGTFSVTGAFTINVTGLTENTVYYYKGFATNAAGSSYTSQATFTTRNIYPPTLTLPTATDITNTTAVLGASITALNNDNAFAKGIVYSTIDGFSENTGTFVSTSCYISQPTAFTMNVTGLSPNTVYYYKGLAVNNAGEGFTAQASFTTANVVPTLTLPTAISITNTTAVLGASITALNGSTATERGIYYSTTSGFADGTGTKVSTTGTYSSTGAFTMNVTGLVVNTVYFYKGFATDDAGTGYTAQATFTTTNILPPTVTLPTAASITNTTAVLGASITAFNGSYVTERGIYYSTTSGFADGSGTKVSETGTFISTGAFTLNVTGLSANTVYYYKGFATNDTGTQFTTQETFTTTNALPPTVTLPTAASVTNTTAILEANISSLNNGNVTERGIFYSTTSGFADGTGTKVSETGTFSSTGVFTINVTGLSPNTLYFYKGFATNAGGSGYSAQASFTTTNVFPPTVTSPTATGITYTSAVLGANITALNDSLVTERGFYYSTTSGFADGTGTKVSETGTFSTTGAFTFNVTGLTTSTRYYYKGFATNAFGTSYTTQGMFYTGAIIGCDGNVSMTCTVGQRANLSFTIDYYGLTPDPGTLTISSYGNSDEFFNNYFSTWQYENSSSLLTVPFTDGSHFRKTIYVTFTPSQVLLYGGIVSNKITVSDGATTVIYTCVITVQGLPVVGNPTIFGITPTSAGIKGVCMRDGNSQITSAGFFDFDHNYTLPAHGTGFYETEIFYLPTTTNHQICFYATNSIGTTYSNWISFNSAPNLSLTVLTGNFDDTPVGTSKDEVLAVRGNSLTPPEGNIIITAPPGFQLSETEGTGFVSSITIPYNSYGLGYGGVSSQIYMRFTPLNAMSYNDTISVVGAGIIYKANVYGNGIDIPILTLPTATNVTNTTAVLGANISSLYNGNALERGIYYSTTRGFTDGTGTKVSTTGTYSTTGAFTINVTGLSPNTVYYYKGFARNAAGSGYTSQDSLTTTNVFPPTVSLPTATSITNTTAILGANISSFNNSNATERGIYYSTTRGFADGAGTKVSETGTFTSTGTFTISVTGLSPNTVYYYKGFATNSAGSGYTAQDSLTTTNVFPPTVALPTATSITNTTAVLGANISSLNNSNATERGIYYSTIDGFADSTGTKVSETGTFSSTGAFTFDVSGLSPNTVYYYKGFATNEVGRGDTSQATFTTTNVFPPTVSLPTATSITNTTAVLGANISSLNNSNATERGIYYSTTRGFADGTGTKVSETGSFSSTGAFTIIVTGLSSNTVYYYKGFATNAAGSGYTSQDSLTTTNIFPPTVTLPTAAGITYSAALLGANISSFNNSDATERGIYYSTTDGFADGTGTKLSETGTFTSTGAFTICVTDLSPNTVYYYKGFATNSAGTGYSPQATFTTYYQPFAGIYTIDNTLPTGGTNFASFTSAVNALNAAGNTASVTFHVTSGQTFVENVPPITLNAVSEKAVTFIKQGELANPVIKAGIGKNMSDDAIVTFKGCDYITFDGIDLQENTGVNTNVTTQAEYGFSILNNGNDDGAQHNTIQNCTVTLAYATTYTTKGFYVYGNGAKDLAANSYNRFYGNSLNGCVTGYYLYGSTASSAEDIGNEIGSSAHGGTITGCDYGVYYAYQTSLKVYDQTIVLKGGTRMTICGIYADSGTACASEIYNNNISLQATSIYAAYCLGVQISYGTASIHDNIIHDFSNTYTSTGSGMIGIYVAAGAAGETNVIYNNQVYNFSSLRHIQYGISVSNTSSTNNIHNNVIHDFTSGATNGYYKYGIFCNTGVNDIYNNEIYNMNITVGSGATICGIDIEGETSTIHGNIIRNMINNSTTVFETYGIISNARTSCQIYDNVIRAISSSSSKVTGIYMYTGAANTIRNNKVYDLTYSGSGTSYVYGMLLNSGTTNYVYNNFVSDLKAPAAASGTSLKITGVKVLGVNNYLWYNTIFLNSDATGTKVNSAVVYVASATSLVDMKNNIFINKSATGSTGIASTIWKTFTTWTGFTSNNNIYNAGESSTQHLICFDGTNSYQSLDSFRTTSGNDSCSFVGDINFINAVTAPYDLDIDPGIPSIAAGHGVVINTPIAVTDDYHYQTRATGLASDLPIPHGPAIGAQEVIMELVPPSVSLPTAASIANTTAVLGATITSFNRINATERGIYYSTTDGFADGTGTKVSETGTFSTTGAFTIDITGLSPNTVYYYKGFATSEAGSGYTAQATFTTTNFFPPIVTLPTATSITNTTAVLGANINALNAGNATERGIYYSTTDGFADGSGTKVSETGTFSTTGAFTISVTGLSPNTKYYYKGFATNAAGSGYTLQDSLITTNIFPPTVESPIATSITNTTAVIGANISSFNNSNATERGIYYSTTNGFANGTGTKVSETGTFSSTGAFSFSVTGLSVNTVYFYKGYATNTAGSGYSTQGTFTTTNVFPPTVISPSSASITNTTAVLGGNISALNNSDATERGIYYSTSSGFANGTGTKVSETGTFSSTGVFTISVSGLSPNTWYYYKAFATNAAGSGYSTQANFKTTNVFPPTVTLPTAASITQTTAMLGANISSLNNSNASERGIYYSTTSGFADSIAIKVSETGTFSSTGAFTLSITGLSPKTVYYYKGFATNSAGTGYTPQATFSTIYPPFAGVYTIDNTLPTSETNFTSFTSAVNALNAAGITEQVTFYVTSGQTFVENVPAITLNAASDKTVTFVKQGELANPVIKAGIGTGTADAIVAFTGCDYITFDSIDLSENTGVNNTATTQAEYGFRIINGNTDGAQHNTIRNCNITLANAAPANTNGFYLLASGTTAAKSNSYNKFYGNSLRGCTTGYSLNGSTTSSAEDTGNEIGSTTCGGTITGCDYGINYSYQKLLKVYDQAIILTGGAAKGNTGIWGTQGLTNTVEIYNNNISMQTTGTSNSSIYGICISEGVTASIHNNVIHDFSSTYASIGNDIYGISLVINYVDQTNDIYNNQVYNLSSLRHTQYGILTRTSAAGTNNVYGNVIHDITSGATNGSFMKGIMCVNGGVRNVYNNEIYNMNITAGTGGGISGIHVGGGISSVHGNIIHNLINNSTTSNNTYGITSGVTTSSQIYDNVVRAISSSLSNVAGIYMNSGLANTIRNNKVYDLTNSGSGTSYVYGMLLDIGTKNYVYNNFVSDLKAPAGDSGTVPNIAGISTQGTNNYLWYNTFFLNSDATGTTVNSTVVHIFSATSLVNMKNNIMINKSATGSNGIASTIWKTFTTWTGFTSNNNIYNAGESSTQHLICFDGTNSYQSLDSFRTSSGNDSCSFVGDVNFVNADTAPYDLDINSALPSIADGTGVVITTPIAVTDDYHYQTRATGLAGDLPDIGADEFAIELPAPSTPENVSLAKETGTGNLIISWDASTGNVSGYHVYGCPNPDFSSQTTVLVGSTSASTLTLTVPASELPIRMFYRVTAY